MELSSQLEEKQEELTTKLKAQRDHLESILQTKVDEQIKLQEEAERNLVIALEEEFSCIICHELFIRATTLACGHTFCKHCLMVWLRKEKNCPICRKSVSGTETAVRSVVLDSTVSTVVQKLGRDLENRRKQIEEEREKESQG